MHGVIVARWRRVSSLCASRVDKFVRRAHHGAMASNKTPDDATGDSVTNAELITRVHAFMCALLTFLGFNALPNETVLDMLDTLTQWLADAETVRRDPQGATAKIWWDAFKTMWAIPKMSASEAGVYADKAANEFGKRFLPVAEEDDRDTLNTADFDAMRTELDQADRYRGEICDALDGRPGERMFVHPGIIDELRAERDALLKANAHHASELATCRIQLEERTAQRDQLTRDVYGALVPLAKPAVIEPGQRWAMIGTVIEYGNSETVATMQDGEWFNRNKMLDSKKWIYLGTDKV